MNFPFICISIPASPSYGVHIPELALPIMISLTLTWLFCTQRTVRKIPPPPNLPGFYQKCLLFTTFLFFFQVDWNLLWISNGHYCYTLRKLIEVCRKCQIMTRWINLWLILLGKHKWFESKVKDFLIPISVLDTTLCDKVCQWLAAGRLFSPGTPVSSSNNTDRHDILKYCWKWR